MTRFRVRWPRVAVAAAPACQRLDTDDPAEQLEAEQTAEAEARLEANHGSASTVDRHNQGKRDQRT